MNNNDAGIEEHDNGFQAYSPQFEQDYTAFMNS